MSNKVHCVIMAGGIGSRFWPMSRQSRPKQFLDILGTGSSLIKLTYDRFKPVCDSENFMVVTSDEYIDQTKEHLSELNDSQILAEPARKNTAPCIAYAAYKLYRNNPDDIMVITSADHIILKSSEFIEAIESAIIHAADTEHLVTVGIKPTRPDSGYGYIQFHQDSKYAYPNIQKVKTFTEKPSVDLALQFIQSGDFYWNSGVFIWKVSAIVKAFEAYMPDLAKSFEEKLDMLNSSQETAAIKHIYGECANVSIDYGVMEQAEMVDVVLGDFGWSDLGTWGSLYEQLNDDKDTNVKLPGLIKTYDTNYSIIKIPNNKLAVVQGLTNYIVIDTDDVLLICQKDEEQKIKQFVQDLKQEKITKFL